MPGPAGPPNLMNIVFRNGWVTFQQSVYIGGVLFKVNHQYKFDQTLNLRVGCGCEGGTFSWAKHYRIRSGNNAFLIDAKNLVETTIPIPVAAQDFENARENQFGGNQQIHDFDSIRTNNDPGAIWRLAQEQAKDNFKH